MDAYTDFHAATMNTNLPSRCCVLCHHRMDGGNCYFKKRHVEDSETCLQFTPRQDAPEPMPAAPLPTPEPLPPAPPGKPGLDLPAETATVEERPRVTGRPCFSFRAFLKDLLGINRLGALSMSNNFPHPNGRGEVKNNITNKRSTP